MNILQKLFGKKEEVNYKESVQRGAIILDVRSKREFESGHIKSAINIPLDLLSLNFSKLGNKNNAIIIYCASGTRSRIAKNILKVNGYINIYNGGGFQSLQRKLL